MLFEFSLLELWIDVGLFTPTLTAFFTYSSITRYKLRVVSEESATNLRDPTFLHVQSLVIKIG